MQKYKDKIDINKKLKNKNKIILDLGCGNRKNPERINIDKLDIDGVDIVANLEEGFSFLPDNCVDEIHSKSLFEHIENFEFFMKEIYRILRPWGNVFIFVPHFSNPYFYSDPTHKRFMGFYTFFYFSKDQSSIRRKVPSFYNDLDFEISSINYYFTSSFPIIREAKLLFGKIINSQRIFQEFYEAHLVNLISAYGMNVVLKKRK